MSLRGRFAAASSAVALLASSAAFSAVWLVYTATQERQLDAALLAEAEEDALDASGRGTAGGPLALHHGELTPVHKYGAVYDEGGRALDWTTTLAPSRPNLELVRHPSGAAFDLWWNNEHLRAVLVPVPGSDHRTFFLATSRADLDGDNAYLAHRMMAAALIAAILIGAATSWLARVLTRDHERITAVARAVAAGDLSARIGPGASDAELGRLGRDIDDMIERLALLVETQQRFIASASHELRSPITAFLGELSLALRRERDAATYREAIEEALGSARRLRELTEDLLTLARVGAAQGPHETVSLAEVSAAAVASTQTVAEARGVSLEVDCAGASVQGHPGDLERLVRNLVENAIRHAPRGSSVRIEAHADREQARVSVVDEGPGVPAEARERIFEPFFRLPADRAQPSGAGLGLAIGRSIARAHGGDLWLDECERGARFVVRLPVSIPGAEA